MADIKTTVLTVDTGGAITNVKEFKQHIEDLKGKLLGLEKGTEEYNTVAKELKDSQQKLNEVMDVAKGKGEAVEGSYDNLVKTMSELKKQWRATADETERAKLGEQILSINNQLKDLDASTGNFQRNVGNYSNAFTDAFNKLSTGISGTVPAVGKLNSAFKLLLSNPIVAFISAIAAALMAVINALKNSESQLNRFKVATAGVQVVVDGFKNVLSKVADAFVTLTEKISNFIMNGLGRLQKVFEKLGWDKWAESLGNFINKVEEYTEAEQKAVDITAKRRKINEDIAKTENKIADLRAKIADKTKYTEDERLKFVEEWEKAEKHRAQLAVDLAQEEYDIIKRKNALTESSEKDLDAESDAYVNLIKAQGQYTESLRTINKQKSALLKGSTAEINNEDAKLVQQILKRLEDAKKTEIQKITEKYNEEKALLEKHGEDTAALTEEYETKIREIEEASKKQTQEKITSIYKRITDSTKSEYEIRLENLEAQYEAEKELFVQNNEDLMALEAYYAEQRKAIKDAQQAEEDKKREESLAKEKAAIKERQQFQMDLANSTATVLGLAGDAWMDYVKDQVESGKMSKKEGEKQFKAAKALQIATAIIQTIAGAVGAFMGITRDTGGWGIAAAAAEAAAVTAAGAVQIAAIANTKLGDTSTGEVSTPNVAEVSNDFTPEYTQNVTAESELSELTNAVNSKISYVSVTDINDVQNKVQVRDRETSY